MTHVDVGMILERLHDEGLLPDRARANELMVGMDVVQPWYVRTMVGFGAWLASLMLMGFVVGLGTIFEGGYMVLGVPMMAGGIFLRRGSQSDFLIQASLAIGLTGQALFTFGLVDLLGWGEGVEAALLAALTISIFLFWLFPDHTVRVLEVLFAAGSAAALIYSFEINELIPFLGPAFAAGLVALRQYEARRAAGPWIPWAAPGSVGLMLSAFACLMLSTIYVLPELAGRTDFYPRPWISTVLLGPLLLYLSARVWSQVFRASRPAVYVGHGLVLTVIGSAWANPGLILALIVVVLGRETGSRAFTGAGVGFLALFLGLYFYGIETTMLTKSMTLVATGLAVLLARWSILKLANREPGNE